MRFSLEVKVGALVLFCTGLLVAFVWVLGDFGGGSGFVIHVDYPTASDIKPGAPVKVAGVNAGKVSRIEYWGGRRDEEVGRHVIVRVTMGLDAAIGQTLHRDARFYISTLGMLGEKYVEIDPGSPGTPHLPDGAKVEGMPPLRMEILAQQLSKVAGVVSRILEANEAEFGNILRHADETVLVTRRTMERADKLLADNAPGVGQLVQRLGGTAQRVDQVIGSVQHAIGDGGTVRRSLDNVEVITGTVRREAPPLLSDARAATNNVRAYAQRLRTEPTAKVVLGAKQHVQIGDVLAKANGAAGDVKAITGKVKDGRGSIGGVLMDNELFMDIKLMVKDLKRHPWKFIWRE